MIKSSKILILVLISVCLLQTFMSSTATAVATRGMANFKNIKTYTSKTFLDISSKQLYYQDVVNAYSYGIISGMKNNKFNPTAYITIAEAIVSATKMNSIYNGGTVKIAPTDSKIGYSGNVTYAEKNKMLTKGEFAGQYTKPVTRAQLAHIFSKSVTSSEFKIKNNIISIPDITKTTAYFNEIMTLYKAGIIVGADAQGNFKPNANVKRSEAATIINRIINPKRRQAYTLTMPKEQNSFKQLMVTGKYVKGTGKIYSQGDCLFLKSAYPDLNDNGIQNNLKWYVFIDPNGGPTYDTKNYECEIILTKWNFDLATRHQVRDALKILYPTGYQQVYDYMMKALNFDLWEAGNMNTLNATSGTMWTRYSDGRAINVQFQYDVGAVKIYFYKTGYTQVPPEQASEVGIKAEMKTAKKFAGWLNIYNTCQLETN